MVWCKRRVTAHALLSCYCSCATHLSVIVQKNLAETVELSIFVYVEPMLREMLIAKKKQLNGLEENEYFVRVTTVHSEPVRDCCQWRVQLN